MSRVFDHPAQPMIREAISDLEDAYQALIEADTNSAYGAVEEARGKLRTVLEKILEHDQEEDD